MWTLLLALQAAAPVAVPSAPARWVLVYAGADRKEFATYTIPHFTRLVAHVDSAGRPEYWQCTGAIFLNLWAPSGGAFTTWIGGRPANGADWVEYVDSLFAPGGVLSRLDSAIGLASATLGPPPDPIRVAIMVPYPEPKSGTLTLLGQELNLRTADGRVGAVTKYIAEVERRFRANGPARLRLDGFYWLHEQMPNADAAVVKRVAQDVHARGFRFLWIPYYDGQGWKNWREFGFDEAWLQPNYFFDRSVPSSRLDSAAARALQHGMGIELEFDGRITATPGFEDRLDPYLYVLLRYPELTRRSIALFDGGGALLELSNSRKPLERVRYDRLGEVMRGKRP